MNIPIPELPPLKWTNVTGPKVFKCFHLPSTAAEARAESYTCYLCGKIINKERSVISRIDKPEMRDLVENFTAGRQITVDVIGYRSDLRLVDIQPIKGLVKLSRSGYEEIECSFWTSIDNISNITIVT